MKEIEGLSLKEEVERVEDMEGVKMKEREKEMEKREEKREKI